MVAVEQHITDKDKIKYEEKARIGKKAAGLILPKDTIILDSGTTTMEVARNIPPLDELTVVTNALNIVNQLSSRPEINIIMLGGLMRRTSSSLVGPLAEKNLQNFFVDKVFMGVDGFDTRRGAYTPNLEEANLNQIMIKNAKEVILVADSSKFLRKSLAFICDLRSIDIIVTDDGILPEDRKRIDDSDIKLIIA
jgi:DeoR family transcriptional regulator of aga operon